MVVQEWCKHMVVNEKLYFRELVILIKIRYFKTHEVVMTTMM